jgi:hypothetical protein
MRISRIARICPRIVVGLIIPLLFWCVDASAFLKEAPQQEEFKATIRAVQVNPDHILITYSLSGSASESYEVSLVLLKEGSPSFRIPVRSASGDIGEGKFSGDSRQVKWEFARDYPSGLSGEGFYFEITVNKVTKSNLLLYLGLGGLAIAGGAAAVLLGGKGGGETTTARTELPFPPTRPSQ